MTVNNVQVSQVKRHVQITVTGDCGHILGVYTDVIEEKYPFWCEQCQDERREGRYPWKLTTQVIYLIEVTPEPRTAERK